jgi:replicative DNA helicase
MIFEELSGEVLQRLGRQKAEPVNPIPTPFESWNEMSGEEGGSLGLARKWVVVVGGADGTGKSQLAYNLVANATQQGRLSGGINYEMSQMQAATRYVAILTGHPKHRLDQGKYYDHKLWLKACADVDRIAEETGGAFLTNQAAVFTLDDIRTAYARLADAGCEMIVVDYAQLIRVNGKDGIFQRSEDVADTLRELTHKHNVLSVVISQFNRETKTAEKPPTRFGLQGGSAWENNANQIILLNHTLRQRTPDNRYEYTELIGDKNRHGPAPFVLPVKWDWTCGRLAEYVPGTDPDDPWPDEERKVQVKGGRAKDEEDGGLFA